jgi:cytochrome c oxidase subunit 2
MANTIARLLVFISTLFLALTAQATPGWNMPYGVTPVSQQIYTLHMASFYVCCAIGFLVFSVLIFSLIKYRKSKGAKAAHFHEHTMVEIIWTTIPFLILVALAIPSTRILKNIHNTEASAITVKIVGYQWKWKYEYLDQGISFFSSMSTPQDQIDGKSPKNEWFLLEVDNPLVVPINTKIKLLVTADDVIHSWWVPELGVKQDGIPGYINENWTYITKPGTYRGQCGELCGVNHGFMPIVVKAVTQEEFDLWLKTFGKKGLQHSEHLVTAKLTKEDLLTLGKTQFDKTCGMCHQPTGLGLPPTFPALKGSKISTGPAEAEIKLVLQGVPGTAMQAFGEQLDDKTLAAILTYTRSAWGNQALNDAAKNTSTVQPIDVAKMRKTP